MIKVFNSTEEFGNYTHGGMVAGDLYYILSDGSVHFRTNNIDGEDKVYEKGDGGSANLTTLEVTENGTYDTTGTDYDGYSSVVVNVAAPVSTDTKITIGFRNVGNAYGLQYIQGSSESANLYLGETNLGTVANISYNEGFMSNKPYGYLHTDGNSGQDTPDNHFVSDREITWVKLNGVKEHTFETLPQSLEIPLYFTGWSKNGAGAPLMGIETSITLPSNIEGKNCILVYDFVPNSEANTYFQLNEDNSFIL